MNLRTFGAAAAALIVAACATAPPGPSRVPPPIPPTPPPPSAAVERTLPFSSLRGWASEDHAEAFSAFRETCGAARDPAMAATCASARTAGALDREAARRFFEARFSVQPAPPAGVLTAYFAPEYPARRARDAEFSAPVRPKPPEALAAAERMAIEALPAPDALAWMRPEDLFFLQVQGSGVLAFEDGRRAKALYAATNGRPFVAIGGPMRERGLLAAGETSAQAIHGWLAAHRGPDADAIMRLNPRYAFFRLAPDDGRQPAGSANVPLPAGRAVAVDRAYHALGELLWIDADRPVLAGARPTYRRLAVALDTGGAIKGPARADLYLGSGPAAGTEAGLVHHQLRLYRLVPAGAP